jgi:hypothetical protein
MCCYFLGSPYDKEADVQGEMMELVMQFGYITLFSTVFPLAAFVCYIANCFNLKSIKMELDLKRRSLPSVSIGIGVYLEMLEFLSNLSVAINFGIAYFTSHDTREFFVESSGMDKLRFAFMVVGVEHGIYLLKIFLREIVQKFVFKDQEQLDEDKRINNLLEEKFKDK